MKTKEINNTQITIYWWNHGRKTLDFKGTYKEWMVKNSIVIKPIRTDKFVNGLETKFNYGSMTMKLKYVSGYMDGLNYVIKVCLTFLGDKALFIDGYKREYKINWRRVIVLNLSMPYNPLF
jgi:hypothetical protein